MVSTSRLQSRQSDTKSGNKCANTHTLSQEIGTVAVARSKYIKMYVYRCVRQPGHVLEFSHSAATMHTVHYRRGMRLQVAVASCSMRPVFKSVLLTRGTTSQTLLSSYVAYVCIMYLRCSLNLCEFILVFPHSNYVIL